MRKENFDLKYNRVYFSQPVVHNYVPISPITQKDAATEIERLHGLMEKGMITQAEFEDAKLKLL
ncbi:MULTISPECIES: SHOCT domain-containing protein [Sphingobacterium]|uniref:SHOCT domain-containing protein n=1 Tax=Sphingobacterium TaxID=28453 RepID=UPI0025803A3C|nr:MULTISPECIES: SHOCT domain-containing protein [Sphingobacterium]